MNILKIDTTDPEALTAAVYRDADLIAEEKVPARRRQSEELLPAIDRALAKAGIRMIDLEKIIVANQGGSFTSLRIGIVTANAMAYALQVPVEGTVRNEKQPDKAYVEPIYDNTPDFVVKKKSL
ncbi:tRNA (adenosine(37)-N6)-threonylcarbamoyltransferase complex dimerization subunit type 1 TsaB [Candidatus Falkowbacteria bacterium]|nr:tRNA (adenosine(37)-N6)-threonylcarbamoyltransferase complex dimerization subunit type 1 TsaB [Candidatus Falkowbacteria bacterium]